MSNNQSSFYQSYIKKLQEKAKKAVKEAQEKSFSEYFNVAEKKIKTIYKDTITDFYNSYPNPFYDRRGSLYELIQTKKTNDYLSMWFDPSKISYRNGYAESSSSPGVSGGLYDLVFRQGWHGGAMVHGSMLYPIGKYEDGKPRAYDGTYKDGYYKPYEDENYKYSWTVANKAAISPLDDFKKRLDKYQKTEYQEDYEKIWNKNKSNIKINM